MATDRQKKLAEEAKRLQRKSAKESLMRAFSGKSEIEASRYRAENRLDREGYEIGRKPANSSRYDKQGEMRRQIADNIAREAYRRKTGRYERDTEKVKKGLRKN